MSQHNDILRQFLEAEDVTCPVCRYQLRNLEGDRCPECGKTLRLHLRPADDHLRRFILACVAASIGFGFFGILVLISVIGMLVEDNIIWPPPLSFYLAIAFAVIEGAALVVLLCNSTRFARARAVRQRALALLCWTVTVLLVAAFAAYVLGP